MSTSDFEPPGEVLVNRRWIKPVDLDWALEADAFLRGHGYVCGTAVYETRDKARGKLRKLRDLLIELDLYESWELEEHTNKIPPSRGKGWQWTLEYKGGGPINGRR